MPLKSVDSTAPNCTLAKRLLSEPLFDQLLALSSKPDTSPPRHYHLQPTNLLDHGESRSLCTLHLAMIYVLFAFLSIIPSSFAAAGSSYLYSNEYLTAGQSITSPNGMFSLVYQTDGNICAYEKDTDSGLPYWCAFSLVLGLEPYYLIMQSDGNFVAYDFDSPNILDPYWATGTNNGDPNCYVTIQDDQNVVVYNSQNVALWTCGCDTASLKDDTFEVEDDDPYEAPEDDVLKDDVVKDDSIYDVESLSYTSTMEVSGVSAGDLTVSNECTDAYKQALYLIFEGFVPLSGITIESITTSNGSSSSLIQSVNRLPLSTQKEEAEGTFSSLVTAMSTTGPLMETYLLQQVAKVSGCSLLEKASIKFIALSDLSTTTTDTGGSDDSETNSNGGSDKTVLQSTTQVALVVLAAFAVVAVAVVVVVRRRMTGASSHQNRISLLSLTEMNEPMSDQAADGTPSA
jgi:hypothetical protein